MWVRTIERRSRWSKKWKDSKSYTKRQSKIFLGCKVRRKILRQRQTVSAVGWVEERGTVIFSQMNSEGAEMWWFSWNRGVWSTVTAAKWQRLTQEVKQQCVESLRTGRGGAAREMIVKGWSTRQARSVTKSGVHRMICDTFMYYKQCRRFLLLYLSHVRPV